MDLPAHNRASDNVHLVPDGLQQLMSDITREVLRSQPENLYCFITEYLEGVMKYRSLPKRFDTLDSYESFSSDTLSTMKSFEVFTPSSSEVVSMETFSSSTPESSVLWPESECSLSHVDEETQEEMVEEKTGSDLKSSSRSSERSVSTKASSIIKAKDPTIPDEPPEATESNVGSETSRSKSIHSGAEDD